MCQQRIVLSLALLVAFLVPRLIFADDPFVRPGNGIADGTLVWGHARGLRIGLWPNPGPRGLIRVYAPFLGQEYPRVLNFISIEPSVVGQRGRDQSELQMSRDRAGKRGLSFWVTNQLESPRLSDVPVGEVTDDGKTLHVFVHTEPFQNGARPIVECIFRSKSPFEIEFVTHAAAARDSAPMTSCVLSATMGNFGQLRRIHLRDGRVESASDLWNNEGLDRLGFLPWRTWPAAELGRFSADLLSVKIATDAPDPSAVKYAPDVAPHWRYVGEKAAQYWRADAELRPIAAVNGRKTYWMSQSPIPGGTAFENFELRVPFREGNRLWFGVVADGD
jgi:hypothetical protein